MKAEVFLTVGVLVACCLVVCAGGEGDPAAVGSGPSDGEQPQTADIQQLTAPAADNDTNTAGKPGVTTDCNGTDCSPPWTKSIKNIIGENRGMLFRTLYVLIAVTGVIVLYFVVRTIRIRRRKSKSKKYGVITPASDMEMTPLDQDDDDEDMTVFEVNGIPK